MSAMVTPTRRPILGRIRARVHAWHLRLLIRSAERDLAEHQREFDHVSKHLPRQLAVDRNYIHSLTLDLIRTERDL